MLLFVCTDFTINPLNPIVHFWLHHTAHCAEKIVSARLRAGSASAERVGQGEVGGVTGRSTILLSFGRVRTGMSFCML